jgi:hypothetical protein
VLLFVEHKARAKNSITEELSPRLCQSQVFRQTTPGNGINFKTKKQVVYKVQRRAAFRPGTLLKQAVRKEMKRSPLSLLTRKKR